MKVCIAVILSRQEPSNRNKKAIYDYIVKDCNEMMTNGELKNEYFFVFYKGSIEGTQGLPNRCSISRNDYDFDIQDRNVLPKNCIEIETPTRDGINYTFEKTIECFKMLENLAEEKEYFNHDWLVRINISTYVNIRLLDHVLSTAKKDLCILHPLPRVNEIATEVDGDSRAKYFEQAYNGVYIRMALILSLLEVE